MHAERCILVRDPEHHKISSFLNAEKTFGAHVVSYTCESARNEVFLKTEFLALRISFCYRGRGYHLCGRGAHLEKNDFRCAHCGKTFARIEQTPVISRYGRNFHVALFAGPGPRLSDYREQTVCDFAYAHDQLGPQDHTVSVVIARSEKDPEGLLRQVEDAADKLADLVEEGHELTTTYAFDAGHLTPGFPK